MALKSKKGAQPVIAVHPFINLQQACFYVTCGVT